MGKSLKYIFLIALLAVIAFGIWKSSYLFSPPVPHVVSSSEVVIERMEKVMKLITLQVHLSEVKDHREFLYYDISPLRKEALIIVKGKVSIGYDFNDLQFEANDELKNMTILNIPDPEILAVEHDLDYRMINEGTFNSFSKDDFNKLNDNAKELIRSAAREDTALFLEAAERKDDMLDMLNWMLDAAGWKLLIGVDSEEVKNPENTY